MRINKRDITPGQNLAFNLHVGKLPTGMEVEVEVHVFRALEEGPAVLFLGGVHGDEVEGVEILRRALTEGVFTKLERGSVVVIPVLNVYGFIHATREVPEGKDINRSFPGSARGSMASRLANAISKSILPVVDMGVDFHSGANGTYNYPQVRYSVGDEGGLQLARQFGAPFLIPKKPIARSLRKLALAQDKPILVYEGGESNRLSGHSIEHGLAGLKRLLLHLRMLPGERSLPPTVQLERSSWVRAGHSGIFEGYKPAGASVRTGEALGVIRDPYGRQDKRVFARRDGFILGCFRESLVRQGDALFHIGY